MSTLDKLQKALDNKTLNTDRLTNEQKIIIEKLKKEIILLNDNIQNINSKKLSATKDYSEFYAFGRVFSGTIATG